MTRLSAFIIANDPECFATIYEQGGLYGIYIGTVDFSPSGSPRPRTLITSQPTFSNAEAAQLAANKVVADAKAIAADPIGYDLVPAPQQIQQEQL